jgi:ribosome-associated protein
MKRLKTKHRDKSALELARFCARTAQDSKAEDVTILDVHRLSTFTDYFVIMSGKSSRHVQGLAQNIEGELSAKRISASKTEGLKEGTWVLLDYGDVVVHIFYREARAFYDLDGLWHDAPRIPVEQHDNSPAAR